MSHIELWKIKELADALEQFASGLKAIQEPEWAQVFSHYEARMPEIFVSRSGLANGWERNKGPPR